MSYKIYKSGSFIVIEDTINGTTRELNSVNVQITKAKTDVTLYSVLYENVSVLSNIGLASILDENGDAYLEAAWDTFRYEQCGAVNSSATPASEYTETIVDISSAQILAMGDTPIELLPAAGVGNYYDVEKIVLEYTYGTVAYTSVDNFLYISAPETSYIPSYMIKAPSNTAVICNVSGQNINIDEIAHVAGMTTSFNQPCNLSTIYNTNPADGDGTMRVKIYHKTITFGA